MRTLLDKIKIEIFELANDVDNETENLFRYAAWFGFLRTAAKFAILKKAALRLECGSQFDE